MPPAHAPPHMLPFTCFPRVPPCHRPHMPDFEVMAPSYPGRCCTHAIPPMTLPSPCHAPYALHGCSPPARLHAMRAGAWTFPSCVHQALRATCQQDVERGPIPALALRPSLGLERAYDRAIWRRWVWRPYN